MFITIHFTKYVEISGGGWIFKSSVDTLQVCTTCKPKKYIKKLR